MHVAKPFYSYTVRIVLVIPKREKRGTFRLRLYYNWSHVYQSGIISAVVHLAPPHHIRCTLSSACYEAQNLVVIFIIDQLSFFKAYRKSFFNFLSSSYNYPTCGDVILIGCNPPSLSQQAPCPTSTSPTLGIGSSDRHRQNGQLRMPESC